MQTYTETRWDRCSASFASDCSLSTTGGACSQLTANSVLLHHITARVAEIVVGKRVI